MQKTVSIIIPTWNGRDLLQKHLPRVMAARTKEVIEVILVDDCSNDGTVEWAREQFEDLLTIQFPRQNGFAAAVNAGVNAAQGGIVILLNNDVSPKKDFLPPLIKHFDDQKVFAVTCLEEGYVHGKIVRRGRGEGYWYRGLLVHRVGRLDRPFSLWATGGNAAFDRKKWEFLGGMDTIYAPFYWEDIDLSYRAWKRGWVVRFESKSVVEHVHESTIGSYFSRFTIQRIGYRNQWLFAWKNGTFSFWFFYHFACALKARNWPMIVGMLSAVIKFPQAISHQDRHPVLSDAEVIHRHQQ